MVKVIFHGLIQPLCFVLCLCVIFRFDGEEIKTDETIRTLAQKWQPTRRPRFEERNTKAVDTDMIVVSCVVSCLKMKLLFSDNITLRF